MERIGAVLNGQNDVADVVEVRRGTEEIGRNDYKVERIIRGLISGNRNDGNRTRSNYGDK